MAVRNIAVTDTIEKFRTEFNALCATDFGDIANLDASLSATNLIEAMNETLVAATNTAGFRVEDSSSSQQLIAGGDTLKVLGTSNEIEIRNVAWMIKKDLASGLSAKIYNNSLM